LLLTGEQSVRKLKVQSCPIARDSKWSPHDGEILCVFAILFQSTRHGKLAESLEKKILVSSAVQDNIQKNDKFSNYRCSHQGELPCCSGDRTARPLYKKDYHKFLGLAYHLRKSEKSMDKRNHFHKYNKSHLTKKKRICLTLSLEYNPGP